MSVIRAAIIQLNSGPVIEDNLRVAEKLIRDAAKDGATLITTPENTCRMRASVADKLATSHEEKNHLAIPFFSNLARELSVTLLVGSISSVRAPNGKLFNRSYLFGKNGATLATYDKIHMFDVDLPNGDKYRESDTNHPGSDVVAADIGDATIGLSICYDIRFPQLYRALAKKGAGIITVPSAFTVPTGEAHWEILLRARAIETGCFVLAPAQVGEHEGGRKTWGHSMIIGPWGKIIEHIQGNSAGYTCADLDLTEVSKAREAIPSLLHDRLLSS